MNAMPFGARKLRGDSGSSFSMIELHARWRAVRQALLDLVEPLDSMSDHKLSADQIAKLEEYNARLEARAKALAKQMLDREPNGLEDFAVLADLALTYDVDGRDHYEPGKFSTFTHIGKIAVALSRKAPHVEFWSLNHEFTPEARATLLAAA